MWTVGLLLAGVVYSMTNAVWPATYAEYFPTNVRLPGMAIGTQFGFGLAGFTPAIAAALAGSGSDGWSRVAIFAAIACAISAIAALRDVEGIGEVLHAAGVVEAEVRIDDSGGSGAAVAETFQLGVDRVLARESRCAVTVPQSRAPMPRRLLVGHPVVDAGGSSELETSPYRYLYVSVRFGTVFIWAARRRRVNQVGHRTDLATQ